MLAARFDEFARAHGGAAVRARLRVAPGDAAEAGPGDLVFDVASRTYTKRGTALEAALMRFLLPDAKFTPRPEPSPNMTRPPARPATRAP